MRVMSQQHADEERRRLQRQAKPTEVELLCPTARPRPRDLPEDAGFCPYDRRKATLTNTSRDGIGAVVDRPLPVGAYQKLVIEGETPVREVPEVQIVRCEPLEDGTFAIGARRS